MYPLLRRKSQNALHYLSTNRIRAADHSRFCYSWMLYQSVFHLKRTNAVPKTRTLHRCQITKPDIIIIITKAEFIPCGQDDIISSANEPQVSFFIHHSPVTRQVEITTETFGRALRLPLQDEFRSINSSSTALLLVQS